jgi:hypothetical protein
MINTTSIVLNDLNKIRGLPPYYYRYRSCDTNITSNTPANRYQLQKQIQNTVRVYSSLYTANLAPLSAYKKPTVKTHNVCWNQMSDRPLPSYQPNIVPTGYFHANNNKRHSVTSGRPGSQTPGGYGVDIKHNSYDRYLNRLKGKGPLRRGAVPIAEITPQIKFNRAFPIYGGKLMKTSIVTGCNCPIEKTKLGDHKIYDNPYYQSVTENDIQDLVGRKVYAERYEGSYYVGTIKSVTEADVLIEWADSTTSIVSWNQVKPFISCFENICATKDSGDQFNALGLVD